MQLQARLSSGGKYKGKTLGKNKDSLSIEFLATQAASRAVLATPARINRG